MNEPAAAQRRPEPSAKPHEASVGSEWPDASPSHDSFSLATGLQIAVVTGAGLLLGSGAWNAFGHPRVFGCAALLVGGYPIFKAAFESVRTRRMTMELSMTIALVAALVIGEVFTALVITAFVLVAEVLEGFTAARGRRAIGRLLDLLPRRVSVRRNGELADIPIEELRELDRVMVLPGGRIPVDGLVLSGESFVDESSITGEPMPVAKREGKSVFAGTINQSGAIEIQSARIGRDTTFGGIINAVERAQQRRAPIQRTADRLAGYLVYVALMAAAVTLLVTHDVRTTISVILVAGACGVAAGTPLAILGAIGQAARNGVIIKGGIHLEALWGIDTVVLDKTGTVTLGNARVRAVYPAARVTVRQLVEAAAIAECRSERDRRAVPSRHCTSSSRTRVSPRVCRVGAWRLCDSERFWSGSTTSSRAVMSAASRGGPPRLRHARRAVSWWHRHRR